MKFISGTTAAFSFTALLLVSCGGEKTSGKGGDDYYSAIEATDANEEAYMDENSEGMDAAEKEMEEALKSSTTLEFDKMEHAFGKIKMDSENDCVFKVKNTGKTPLVISDVQASCGCTTPQKPEKPIPPGKSDVIKVHYKPNSKSVDGKPLEKTITVTANTEPRMTILRINAIVD